MKGFDFSNLGIFLFFIRKKKTSTRWWCINLLCTVYLRIQARSKRVLVEIRKVGNRNYFSCRSTSAHFLGWTGVWDKTGAPMNSLGIRVVWELRARVLAQPLWNWWPLLRVDRYSYFSNGPFKDRAWEEFFIMLWTLFACNLFYGWLTYVIMQGGKDLCLLNLLRIYMSHNHFFNLHSWRNPPNIGGKLSRV